MEGDAAQIRERLNLRLQSVQSLYVWRVKRDERKLNSVKRKNRWPGIARIPIQPVIIGGKVQTSQKIGRRRRPVAVVSVRVVGVEIHGGRMEHTDGVVEGDGTESDGVICALGSDDVPAARPRARGFSRVRRCDRFLFEYDSAPRRLHTNMFRTHLRFLPYPASHKGGALSVTVCAQHWFTHPCRRQLTSRSMWGIVENRCISSAALQKRHGRISAASMKVENSQEDK